MAFFKKRREILTPELEAQIAALGGSRGHRLVRQFQFPPETVPTGASGWYFKSVTVPDNHQPGWKLAFSCRNHPASDMTFSCEQRGGKSSIFFCQYESGLWTANIDLGVVPHVTAGPMLGISRKYISPLPVSRVAPFAPQEHENHTRLVQVMDKVLEVMDSANFNAFPWTLATPMKSLVTNAKKLLTSPPPTPGISTDKAEKVATRLDVAGVVAFS